MAKSPLKKDEHDKSDIRKWLEVHDITYKHFQRDFSDAVLISHLIKKLYPKLIDLHNYPSRSSFHLKLNNWETLNTKALSRLGLHQTKSSLEKLAKGASGSIENLLRELMHMHTSSLPKEEPVDKELQKCWVENDDIMMVNVNKKVGDAILQVPQKMILYSIYEQVIRDIQQKDAYLCAAQQKITHLENILKLKAERIDELSSQLAKLSVRALTALSGPNGEPIPVLSESEAKQLQSNLLPENPSAPSNGTTETDAGVGEAPPSSLINTDTFTTTTPRTNSAIETMIAKTTAKTMEATEALLAVSGDIDRSTAKSSPTNPANHRRTGRRRQSQPPSHQVQESMTTQSRYRSYQRQHQRHTSTNRTSSHSTTANSTIRQQCSQHHMSQPQSPHPRRRTTSQVATTRQ